MDTDVPITGTDHYCRVYELWRQRGCAKDMLRLERDFENMQDPYAVKVMYKRGPDGGLAQMGWVARTHSSRVSRRMVDHLLLPETIVFHNPTSNPMKRLIVRFKELEKPAAPASTPRHFVKVFGALTQDPQAIQCLRTAAVGRVFDCISTDNRTSISLAHRKGGSEVAWFRKEEPGAFLSDELIRWASRGELVARVEFQNPVVIGLYRRGDVMEPETTHVTENMPEALAAARAHFNGGITDDRIITDGVITTNKITAGSITASNIVVRNADGSVIADGNITTPNSTQTKKDNTMNNFFSRLIAINTKAAGDAAYLETGRIANNTVIKIVTARLPFMARFYAKTPFGKLATANAAIMLAQQLRPSDERLQRLTAAMATTAYQEAIQLIDIEGMIDQLMAEPAIKRALDKLEPKADGSVFEGRPGAL